jgi:uncharacterized membrane protein YdcZ (DUF606 family)
MKISVSTQDWLLFTAGVVVGSLFGFTNILLFIAIGFAIYFFVKQQDFDNIIAQPSQTQPA